MEQQQISPKKQKALEKVKRANAELAKVVREEKEQLRKTQDRHKYMMGGCVVKYFPEAYAMILVLGIRRTGIEKGHM